MNKKIVNVGVAIGILVIASIVAMAASNYPGIVKTSKSPEYGAMFGNFVEIGADWNPSYPAEIANVSFYLPVDAYVYVSSFGDMSLVCGDVQCPESERARMWTVVDNKDKRADWDYYKFDQGAFSLSSFHKLKKGYHTAYLMGEPVNNAKLGYMSANIVAIATKKGTIDGSGWFIQE